MTERTQLAGWSKRRPSYPPSPRRQDAPCPRRGRSEVRDAKNNERHACGRRRGGEPAVSRAEASRSYPPTPSLPGQALFPMGYVEGLNDARTKPAAFFNILLHHFGDLVQRFRGMDQQGPAERE